MIVAALAAGLAFGLILRRGAGTLPADGAAFLPILQAIQLQVSGLGERAAETGAVTGGLHQSAEAMRLELNLARQALAALQATAQARLGQEDDTARSLRRLEQVIAGTSTKGTAGENIVELIFGQFPPEWQVRNFKVGNHVVEFGLRLPNTLLLPIDSKWPATALLEQFLASTDAAERQRLKARIDGAVVDKAREVQAYLHPDYTMGFGVAVVPDAILDLCSNAQVEAMKLNVVVVGYSMFLPYLLLVVQVVLRAGRTIDLEKLASHLQAVENGLGELEAEIEGRLSRTVTMLANSRDDLRSRTARVRSGLGAMRMAPGIVPETAPDGPGPEAIE